MKGDSYFIKIFGPISALELTLKNIIYEASRYDLIWEHSWLNQKSVKLNEHNPRYVCSWWQCTTSSDSKQLFNWAVVSFFSFLYLIWNQPQTLGPHFGVPNSWINSLSSFSLWVILTISSLRSRRQSLLFSFTFLVLLKRPGHYAISVTGRTPCARIRNGSCEITL